MKARVRALAALLCISSSFLGCSKDEKSAPTPPPPYIDISTGITSVVANGSNSVTLNVLDTGGGPVTVTTTRGTFGVAGQSTSVAGASGAVTLLTCNSATDGTCAGTAVVTATSASGSDSVSITFGTLAAACFASCAADAGCASLACNLPAGATGTCSATTPSTCLAAAACTPTEAAEASCADGADNDCDGKTDCADTDCADRACRTGEPAFLCKASSCTDTTSGLALEVTPARTRLPAVANATTAVTVSVTSNGAPVAGMNVSIATTFGSLGTLPTPNGTTGADGTATFTLTLPGTAGVATVTASLADVPRISGTATVTVPRLGAFQLPPNPADALQHAVLGARGSGWNELGSIQIQVLDDQGAPYPDGLPVTFEHRVLGGSNLGPTSGDAGSCTAPACVAFQTVTSSGGGAADSAGLAKAFLHSGTLAGTLVTSARASADGLAASIDLPTVAVVGAKASGTNFSIVCSPRNVPALAETDCAVSLVDAPFTCAAILKDRYDNLLGTATQVVFAAEAGAVGPVATTPAYDPALDPTSQADLGVATQIVNTLGAGLPFDVPAIAGEPAAVNHGLDGCGLRDHNPRDGVVTVVAVADGEEAFFDANGNGVYDPPSVAPAYAGDPFVDQGEPFVDQDDSGAWEPGEWFLDVDGNAAYTARNGVWDASRKIWTQTAVVFTGGPAGLGTSPSLLGTRWVGGPVANACTPTATAPSFDLGTTAPAVPSALYSVVASDANLNLLSTATSYAVAVQQGAGFTATYEGFATLTDELGFFYRYWPCDQAGASCASQCRVTGASAPCTMRPSLSAFSCGYAAPVILEAGTAPDGATFVDWLVDTPWDVYGGAKFAHSVRRLPGQAN